MKNIDSNIVKRFKIGKLVRDGVSELIKSEGLTVHERVMELQEYSLRLKDKLIEEAKEVENAFSKEELKEELADVLEVIHALAEANNFTLEEIEKVRLSKRNRKGGFDRRIYCDFMDVHENNPRIDYFLSRPAQYPQIQPDSSCIFCQIANRQFEAEIIKEFQHCFAIKDQFPVSQGHILIIPYNHTANWFTAPEEVRLDIMHALTHMKGKLDAEYAPDGYNFGANCSEFAGQTVMHLHVHLIPRYKGDVEDPKGGVRGVIPSKQKYPT